MHSLTFKDIESAQQLIQAIIKKTPVVQSSLLNTWLGHNIFFKAECLQTTGAFKLRGASHFLAKLAKNNQLPNKIVANSSGNHAQAVAYAAKYFNIPVTIYSSANISSVKAAATRYYGAQLALYETRVEADHAVAKAAEEEGTLWIPPFNHPNIIAGQGTAAYEGITQVTKKLDAVFAPCGGGGLVSGSLISTRHLLPHASVIGVEPLKANDAANSLRANKIIPLASPANTLADGAATPSVGQYTFPYLQQLDDFIEVNERDIAYWTQWLQHLLKLHIEPTSAMSMQGVVEWLRKQTNKQQPKNILVIISGGNISSRTMKSVWERDYLNDMPKL